MIRETWTLRQEIKEEATRQGGAPTPQARPPPSWAPRCSTDVLLPPIYTYVPPNDQIRSQKPNSTAATFCRSHLGACSGAPPERTVITEGFYIIIASPMKCEQFTSDLRVHSQQLDGFFSLFGSQYKVLPLSCGDLFDVIFFLRCVC